MTPMEASAPWFASLPCALDLKYTLLVPGISRVMKSKVRLGHAPVHCINLGAQERSCAYVKSGSTASMATPIVQCATQ
ncbi:hypothetical protein NDU88_005115 [Pleurodeles waltl]|uniref:Uncharacterized protein n=1 Tax=Pleurodeles waltl TaxID=8319 RepID=A0AAV7PIN5_PLEWA|nr:hypothetical protein NDU88_005115 [Pleurodeles waltl]